MDTSAVEQRIRTKMEKAELSEATIRAFLRAVRQIGEGATGMITEDSIDPIPSLPKLADMAEPDAGAADLHRELAVIKLNGGLGTGMGLDKAKSLIEVKGEDTFLDFTARQILNLRGDSGSRVPSFYLMNSFNTQKDTLDYLSKYPDLADDEGCLDFLQSQVLKIDGASLEPVSWPKNATLEWCPPGHGDIYPSLQGSGLLDRLLGRGIKYLFVSNSDNLGATVDFKVLKHFADSGVSFMMEVAQRTAADRKGGHLARRKSDGRLLLRESAQTLSEDVEQFQDISKHQFFNTNNLWIRLDHLKDELERQDGSIPLPLIKNTKTVDPKDTSTPKVLQLESAMGAAIECFDKTGAVVVPRTRFAPVKTTSDLLSLRSDAYTVTEDQRLVLDSSRDGQPPIIELDSNHYKVMAGFQTAFGAAAPSLVGCQSLKVKGPLKFEPGVVCRGNVAFTNTSDAPQTVAAGEYQDAEKTW